MIKAKTDEFDISDSKMLRVSAIVQNNRISFSAKLGYSVK